MLAEQTGRGVMLESGAEFPGITASIAGAPVSGSWWGHPLGNLMYRVLEALGEQRDEPARVRLLNGKVTWLHARYCEPVFTIGSARAPWQIKDLPPHCRSLLRKLDKGTLRLGAYKPRVIEGDRLKPGAALRRRETRLLVTTEEVHTEGGRHAKVVCPWVEFASAHQLVRLDVAASRRLLETLVEGGATGRGALPWT